MNFHTISVFIFCFVYCYQYLIISRRLLFKIQKGELVSKWTVQYKNTVNIGCWIKNIIFHFFPRYVEYKKAKFKQNNQIRWLAIKQNIIQNPLWYTNTFLIQFIFYGASTFICVCLEFEGILLESVICCKCEFCLLIDSEWSG